MLPTLEWQGPHVRMLDQRRLPREIAWVTCRTSRDVIRAIRTMVVRGAPAIGVAAAMGLALGAQGIRARTYEGFRAGFQRLAGKMLQARPTAVNLRWAVERMGALVDRMKGSDPSSLQEALRRESEDILLEDIAINREIGLWGEALVPPGATILTHCNAGSLATAGYGTALGVIRAAHEAGKGIQVIADETRPWLQGLRLTAFELLQDGIPVTVIADNAAGSLMRQGRIQMVVTGADRIAANGDVANKIGTYQVAVLARAHGIPFYVAAPVSTIDPRIPDGDAIPVEERPVGEILCVGRTRLAPEGLHALNPVFDITPAAYVTGIVTERGVLAPPYGEAISKLFAL